MHTLTATPTLTLDVLRQAIDHRAAALRRIANLQPVAGEGTKVYPATYQGGVYAEETRVIDGQSVKCVLLDSVQSQANRMELVLLEAARAGEVKIPLVTVQIQDPQQRVPTSTVSSLEAPHRLADAILRDSLTEDGTPFRRSPAGRVLDTATPANARELFGRCPTALLWGMWDSTGPRGGSGTKFARAMVSEMVAVGIEKGVHTSSRLPPGHISSKTAVYETDPSKPENKGQAYTTNRDLALYAADKPKPFKGSKGGKPSNAGHGNFPPSVDKEKLGGVTMQYAQQTTVISLAGLRKLRFPEADHAAATPEVNAAAQVTLAALGLLAATLSQEDGLDLRSRCQLVPSAAHTWELVGAHSGDVAHFVLTRDTALALFRQAVAAATEVGLPWYEELHLHANQTLLDMLAEGEGVDDDASAAE